MFGPESGKHGWSKLPFVYDKVRVMEDGDQVAKCDQFLSIFEQEVIPLRWSTFSLFACVSIFWVNSSSLLELLNKFDFPWFWMMFVGM